MPLIHVGLSLSSLTPSHVPWLHADFVSQPEALVGQMLDLNVGSVASLCRSFGADFEKAQRGSILVTGSLTALAPLPGAAVYGATKVGGEGGTLLLGFGECGARCLPATACSLHPACPAP